MSFYKNKRVFVTGGTGFIGSHLVRALENVGARVTAPSRKEADLSQADAANKVIAGHDLVFHLAAAVGGIHYNQTHPASLLHQNLLPT